MNAWLTDAYPWIKSFHIISMVAWMAGLLYLPRLFVYHAMAPVGSDRAETFKVMERRLLRGIMTPAMIATWGFGLMLAGTPGLVDWRMGWIWAKLALVAALSAGERDSGVERLVAELDRVVTELETLARQ